MSQADIKQEARLLSSQDPTMKKEADIKPEAGVDNCGYVDDFSSIADKLFEDALLNNSPWILAYGNFIRRSSSYSNCKCLFAGKFFLVQN